MNPDFLLNEAPRNRAALRELYATDFRPRAWVNDAEPQFICITLIERSIALFASQLGGELLDVGCGSRPYDIYFEHVTRKWNSDYNPRRGVVDFVSSAVRLPLADASFDSILCTEVLEHVPDPHETLREFHRVLRPGGKVLLSTPMYWPSHEQPFDFFRYPEYGLRHIVERNGFQIETMLPRGGAWAFWGQVTLHVMPQYIRFGFQRRLWNRTMLALDRWRGNAQVTMGWTVLARRVA